MMTLAAGELITSQTNSVGGAGGTAFEFTDPQYIAGLSVTVYNPTASMGNSYVGQLQLTTSDGRTITFGTVNSSYTSQVYSVDLSNDSIQTLQLVYSSFQGGRLGGILLQTVNGQTMNAANLNVNASVTPAMINGNEDVENYYIVGVFGTSGADIDSLGFVVASDDIIQNSLSGFSYTLTSNTTPSPITLDTITVDNQTSTDQVSSISFDQGVETTSTWESTAGLSLGSKITLETGIPFIAEGSVEFSVEASYSYAWGGSLATSQSFAYDATVTVPAQSSITAQAVVLQSELDMTFTATLTTTRIHTGTKTSTVSGSYSGVSAFDVQVTYTDNSTGQQFRAPVPVRLGRQRARLPTLAKAA